MFRYFKKNEAHIKRQLVVTTTTHTQLTNMEQIIRYNKFDASKVTFTDMKQNRYGGKTVGLKYNGKALVLQTPKMYLPYGLSEYHVKDSNGNSTGDVKYSLDLSFKGWNEDGNTTTKVFYENMNAFDERLVAQGVENRVGWFKSKSHTKEVIQALYSSAVRLSKDKETGEVTDKWPPTMKAKVWRKDDGSFRCETYSAAREQVDFEESVVKGCYVQALVSCSGVWFAGGKFGVSWQVRQMIVHPPMRITGYSFLEDEDDVEATTDDTAEDTVAAACKFYEDDEDTADAEVLEETEVFTEEEVVEEVVEEVLEAPKPKKKRATKRKTVRKSKKATAAPTAGATA